MPCRMLERVASSRELVRPRYPPTRATATPLSSYQRSTEFSLSSYPRSTATPISSYDRITESPPYPTNAVLSYSYPPTPVLLTLCYHPMTVVLSPPNPFTAVRLRNTENPLSSYAPLPVPQPERTIIALLSERLVLSTTGVYRTTTRSTRSTDRASGTGLRACYAMSGTDIGYDGISLCARYVMYDMPSGLVVSASARALRCRVLTESMVVSAMRCPPLKAHNLVTITVEPAICLRACYAMSGTDIAYGSRVCAKERGRQPKVVSRNPVRYWHSVQCYPATLSAYTRAMRCPAMLSRYELCGTDMGYAAARPYEPPAATAVQLR
eukprot:1905481-Rhodomonas_salina.2